MGQKHIRQAKRYLESLGITPENKLYETRPVVARTKTIRQEISLNPLTKTLGNMSETKFIQVPILQEFNPYKALLRSVMDGTYTEELRVEVLEKANA